MEFKNISEYEIKLQSHRFYLQELIVKICLELYKRSAFHDLSKFEEPERSIFEKINFIDIEYGSKEYYNRLQTLDKALKHHYSKNRHHPEHFKNGIKDMNLIDIIEMLCDWISASKNYNNIGDINKSIEIGQKRFCFDDTLKSIFLNTIEFLESEN